MKFNKLRELTREEINKRCLWNLKTEEEFKQALSHFHKTYIGTEEQQKKKLLRFMEKRRDVALNQKMELLKSVENAEDFNGNFSITVEYTKNYTWGYTLKGYGSDGFESEIISGCGYCKQSTATGYVLSSNLSILKLMYALKEKLLLQGLDKDEIKNKIGYGSGYSMLPRFEGGVGITSHERILENLGLKMSQIGNGKLTDVFNIIREVKEA